MTVELELCPECKKSYLRPTGQSRTAGKRTEPFRETGSMRIFVCDDYNCGLKVMKSDKES